MAANNSSVVDFDQGLHVSECFVLGEWVLTKAAVKWDQKGFCDIFGRLFYLATLFIVFGVKSIVSVCKKRQFHTTSKNCFKGLPQDPRTNAGILADDYKKNQFFLNL